MSANQVSRRALLAGIAAAPFVRSASAQAAWPNRPVQVMVPYPPAGGADTTARILYAKVGAMLGQQFVIENRGGAGGTIGEAVVAKAAPTATPFCMTPPRIRSTALSIRIFRSTTTRISTRWPWCHWCRIFWW